MGSDPIETPTFFLHGFWGQAADWDFLKQAGFKNKFQALDYTKIESLGPENYLSDWGQNFLQWKKRNYGSSAIEAVGYSQGGRLLLQAFATDPSQFKKMILISSHPGLQSFAEKEQRLESDRQWARKFRKLDWQQLQNEWNSQGVFHSQPTASTAEALVQANGSTTNQVKSKAMPARQEADFDRETLALCFENWSLAHQQDFRNLIMQYSNQITVIVGADDTKYVQLYQGFLSAFKMEKGAAHRVPFDQPYSLVENLNSILV